MPGSLHCHCLPATLSASNAAGAAGFAVTLKNRSYPVCAVALSIVLLLVATIRIPAVDAATGPPAGPPPLVKIAAVIEQDVNPPARYSGHVEPVQTVDLRARVEGYLESVNFKEGGEVRAGDLLFVIEKAPFQARVENDLAVVAQAEASLDKALQYLRRTEAVPAGGLAATDLDSARAEVRRAQAVLDAARANLKLARISLDYTAIKAPIGGRIGRAAFTRGNLVNASSGPLARIVQMHPIRVLFSISENEMSAFNPADNGDGADKAHAVPVPRIQMPAGQPAKSAGRIDFVDNAVDPGTGSIAVRALFENREGTLVPGQYVTVLVSRSAPRSMPLVPQAAVLEDQQGHYVLVVDGQNRVEQRRVKTGPVIEGSWVIASGLAAGEMVVVEGVQKARPGQIVKTADK